MEDEQTVIPVLPADESKSAEGGSSAGTGSVTRGPVARVVLPAARDDDTDDEAEVNGHEETSRDDDFLEDFPDETAELELVHSRIGSLEPLRLTRFAAHLKKLCLRQNHISFLDPEVFGVLTELEELDFYDNKIKHLGDALNKLTKLTQLDLSFNLIRAVPEGLQHLKDLTTVFFIQNKISKISGLESNTALRSLELGGNKIRTIENLDALVNLEELWIGKNKITKLENLGSLKKLRILSLQSNRITRLEGLEELTELEELYLSHNGVEKIEGLEKNAQLKTLDIGSNFVSVIENISHLSQLEELWMNGNKIPDLTSLDSQLGHLKSLATLYLEHNPCQKSDMTGYRRKIMLALPQLKQIDATYVRAS